MDEWPSAMSRAKKERYQHCKFPGCTRTHHLQIHHIVHWADGGSTSVSNVVCLCAFHHSLVHEGGYTIEHASDSEYQMNEQFEQQRQKYDATLCNVEKNLPNDKESFDTIRKLSPTRYRFRVMNAQGVDIRALPAISDRTISDRNTVETDAFENDVLDTSGPPGSYRTRYSTRVECVEPELGAFNLLTPSDFVEAYCSSIALIAH